MSKKPTVLMILDGYGLNEKTEGNAIAEAKKPVMDRLMKEYPFVKGYASGMAVGLPEGQMGNSEVGHINMGAGRIVYQELTRITKEIHDGTFFDNAALLTAIDNCKRNDSALHLYGLLSNGGVHSHNAHLYALLKLAKAHNLEKVYVHAFLDGRDTPPASGKGFVEELWEQMKVIGVGKIATVMGRYYAMDRDNRWDRVEKAYRAMACGEGEKAENAVSAVQNSYDAEKYDEFVLPSVVMENGQPVATIKEHDSIIFFNFRPDRAREITRAFCDEEFLGFKREERMDLTYVCFSEYDITIPNKIVAFHKVELNDTFGQFLAKNHMTQLRLAETEKYAHVTFFFNAGVEVP
ncbi:MAG TPA: 2,3-bisphosphoglycerate-independent phosphoglycerate mutase, partial [Mobilitalea sp.]|nr:2,3-bisphosphoglycerate-independent phosphoglycerate mutase [Mobilitalea sp.]